MEQPTSGVEENAQESALISSDEDEPEITSASMSTTESTQNGISDKARPIEASQTDPRIVWTEDLDEEDTLAVSDDESIAPPPKKSSDVVVEIDDDTVNVGPSVGEKRPNNVTIDISDDEENTDSSPRRSKRNKADSADEDAILAGVLATFNDEMNSDFIEL